MGNQGGVLNFGDWNIHTHLQSSMVYEIKNEGLSWETIYEVLLTGINI